MTYKHGVYASEIETSISPAVASESALPFVVGMAKSPKAKTLPMTKIVSSWEEFVDWFGDDEPETGDFATVSLSSFADFWFRIMGRGRAIFCAVSYDRAHKLYQSSKELLINGINSIDNVYAQFGVVPTLLLCPYFSCIPEVRTAMIAKAESFGGKWECLALIDAPAYPVDFINEHDEVISGQSIAAISDSTNLASWKSFSSAHAAVFWPYVGVGDKRYNLSTVCAAVMARTDAQNGDYPYVSPSNKQAGIDGAYVSDGMETPVFMTEQKVNDDLNAKGIVGVVNSAAGWVIWGNHTTIYPTSTDVKDSQIPIRRMFSFVKSMFLQFCAGRVDLPLNKRQLDGIINSFNQQLQGLKGMGAVNSASVRLADTNTTLSLLDGIVYIHILISPPPPMRVIEGVVEYDVTGFIESLA